MRSYRPPARRHSPPSAIATRTTAARPPPPCSPHQVASHRLQPASLTPLPLAAQTAEAPAAEADGEPEPAAEADGEPEPAPKGEARRFTPPSSVDEATEEPESEAKDGDDEEKAYSGELAFTERHLPREVCPRPRPSRKVCRGCLPPPPPR